VPNALTDIAWIETVSCAGGVGGLLTPRDALLHAHEIRGGVAGFNPLLSGVRIGAQFRFLMGLAALVVREQGEAGTCLSPEAVDAVFARLAGVSDPFDAERPFLQAWRSGAERDFPVEFKDPSKLNLAVESAGAQAFWSLKSDKWLLVKALHSLLEFSTYAPTSNNKIHGRSCWNSSPGRGYVPDNLPSTELLWSKDTLFDALVLNIPKTWVTGTGLPHWADPTGVHAVGDITGGEDALAPIWTASWTGNIAIAEWKMSDVATELTELTGVALGGSANYGAFLGMQFPEYVAPPKRDKKSLAAAAAEAAANPDFVRPEIPLSEATPEQKVARKAAMYIRDLNDPLRIIEDRLVKNILVRVPYRLNPAESASRVLVSWKSKNLSPLMSDRGQKAIRPPGRDGHRIVFLIHEYAGTSSSPQLRFSQHRQMSAIEWIDADDRAEEVADLAKRIDQFAYMHLVSLFGKDHQLENLSAFKNQFMATFWEEVTAPFTRFITVSDQFVLPAEVHADIRRAVRNTFTRMQEITPITNGGIALLTAAQAVELQSWKAFPGVR
jgi:hypothetical protein